MVAVHYRYQNESYQTIEGADSWSIDKPEVVNVSLWQAMGKVYDDNSGETFWFISQPLSTNTGTIEKKDVRHNASIPNSLLIGEEWRIVNNGKSYSLGINRSLLTASELTEQYANRELAQLYYPVCYPYLNDSSKKFCISGLTLYIWRLWVNVISANNFYYDTKAPVAKCISTKPVIEYWHPAKADKLYRLRIYKEGVEVFTRTSLNYTPSVYVTGRECPLNTCPIKCGSKVCCYGSDGISVKNFEYSESIYY